MGDKLLRLTGALSKKSKVHDLGHAYHFLQMRGPEGKGFAEMAVSRVEPTAAALCTGLELSGGVGGEVWCGRVGREGAIGYVCVNRWGRQLIHLV